MRRLVILSILLGVVSAFPLLLVATANLATGAASSSVSCGDTIMVNTTLTSDLTDCVGNGLTIGADSITLDCDGHTIDGDDSGADSGISVSGRSWDTIKNCVVTGFSEGIRLSGSDNSLMDNTVNSNGWLGIILPDSSDTTLANNIVNSNGGDGIVLSGSNDTITGNTIRDNAGAGLYVIGSNTITNNYFSNAHNASASSTNTWNIAKTPGTNIIGGPYLGGNYWSDYTGADTDHDGLGDTDLPYTSNGSIQTGGDYAPLLSATGPVGGIAELPEMAGWPANAPGPSGPNPALVAGLAAATIAGLTAVGGGAWYGKRRWLRRRA